MDIKQWNFEHREYNDGTGNLDITPVAVLDFVDNLYAVVLDREDNRLRVVLIRNLFKVN